MTAYTALIFDLDGTLIDSAPDIAAALNEGFACNGWPRLDPDHVERFIGKGPHRLIRDILEDLGIPHDEEAVKRAFDGYLKAYLDDPASRTRFYAHVQEDLAAFKARGVRLGICTNKNNAVTGKVLERLGLAELFDAAIGADAVPACKPDPGHLLAVARSMGLGSDGWAYIGDTGVDKATAEAANVPFYVVPWGGGPEVSVEDAQRLTRLADLLPRGAKTSVAE